VPLLQLVVVERNRRSLWITISIYSAHFHQRRNALLTYAGAQIGSESALTLQTCWHFAREDIMKRNSISTQQSAVLPVVWNEAEFAATWNNITDTCDDRVSEDIFDVEDEHAEVDLFVRGMDHGTN
jgi:hypothetical protein